MRTNPPKPLSSKTTLSQLLAFIFASLACFASVRAEALLCESVFLESAVGTSSGAKEVISSNSFTDNRILDEYLSYFIFRRGRSLEQTFKNLRPNSVWFDMGSGRNIALVKGLQRYPQLAMGVGVSYKRAEFALEESKVPGRMKLMKGELLEEMSAHGRFSAWNGKVDLITDVFGPASYTDNFAKVMKIYLDLLHPNGELFLTLQVGKDDGHVLLDSRESFIAYNPVRTEAGLNPYGLVDWLKSIRGIEVEVIAQEEYRKSHYERTLGVRIHKVHSVLRVPDNLKMLLYDKSIPPKRMFSIEESKDN